MSKLLNRFRELGLHYNLNFSNKAILDNCLLGFDAVQRKLLVLNRDNECSHELIDLHQLEFCFVKKTYGTIDGGALKNKRLEHYLEKIILCLELKTEKRKVEIVFYRRVDQPLYQLFELEQMAKDWEALLSKIPGKEVKRTSRRQSLLSFHHQK